MEKYEYNGETYYFNDGRWMTSKFVSAPAGILGSLNALRMKDVDLTKMSVSELIAMTDGARLGDSNIHLAMQAIFTALDKANMSELRVLLPRGTSNYRKLGQSRKAIEFAENAIEKYGKPAYSPVLFTSLAAAYADVAENDNDAELLKKARYYADRANGMSGGKASVELKSVYARLRAMYEKSPLREKPREQAPSEQRAYKDIAPSYRSTFEREDKELIPQRNIMEEPLEEPKEIEPEKLRFIEWNVHAKGNPRYTIPEWIPKYFYDADIIVLTEFRSGKGWDAFLELMRKDYHVVTSPFSSDWLNQVLIAAKRSKLDMISVQCANIYNVNVPEILVANVRGKTGNEFSVIGARIKTEGEADIDKQLEYLSRAFAQKQSFLCVGDFNASFGYLSQTLKTMECDAEVTGPRISNDGCYSFVHKSNDKRGLDWIVCNGVGKPTNPCKDKAQSLWATYIWDFVNEKNGYGSKTKADYLDIDGLPDHAILMAEIEMP